MVHPTTWQSCPCETSTTKEGKWWTTPALLRSPGGSRNVCWRARPSFDGVQGTKGPANVRLFFNLQGRSLKTPWIRVSSRITHVSLPKRMLAMESRNRTRHALARRKIPPPAVPKTAHNLKRQTLGSIWTTEFILQPSQLPEELLLRHHKHVHAPLHRLKPSSAKQRDRS